MSPEKRRQLRGATVYRRGKRYSYVIELEPDLVTKERRREFKGGYSTEEEAWAAAIKAKAAADEGRRVAPSRRTVRDFSAEWLAAIQHSVKPSTYVNYTDYLDAYILPTIGDRRLQEISVPILNAFYRRLLESGRRKRDSNSIMYQYWLMHRSDEHEPSSKEIAKACNTSPHAARDAVLRYRRGRIPTPKPLGLAPKTVKNVHRMLHRALKDAVAWSYITENPAEHASLPRTRRGTNKLRPTPWTLEQLTAWLDLALNDRYAALWMLVATSGMRRSELAGLRRKDLNLEVGLAAVGDDTRVVVDGNAAESDGKTDASGRTISLDAQTVELLHKHLETLDSERTELGELYQDDDRLFCFPNGKAPHPDTITAMFNRLVDQAGAPHIRLHDVRHTYATLSLDAGIDLKIVSDRLGHANVYVTAQIYGHRSTGNDRAAAQHMADLIGRHRE